MNKLFIKLLGLMGIGSVGTGVGGAMADNGVDAWAIAATILGILFAGLKVGKWATNYQKFKNLVDVVDKALEDDKLSADEIRQIWLALKTEK